MMPSQQSSWGGTFGSGADWALEVETDRLAVGGPIVVTVWIDGDDTDGALAALTPDQARELAAVLPGLADAADAQNEREGL